MVSFSCHLWPSYQKDNISSSMKSRLIHYCLSPLLTVGCFIQFQYGIQQIYKMHKTETETMQVSQHFTKSDKQKLVENPRKAATKLKQVNNNLDIMKKRFKVLQVQDEYNRYRTVDQEKRINMHQEIHSRLLKEREILKKSLQKNNDTTEVKEQAQQIRQEIKQKIKQARKNLINQRTERVQSISEQFAQHTLLIKENKEKEMEANRERSLTVKFQEQKKRQSLSRHYQEKVKTIRLNKSIDTGSLIKKAEKGEQQLSKLMMYQQQLLKKSSESLQASQLMKHKFNEVFTTISSSNTSRLLPEIRAKTNNSKYTTETPTPNSQI